MAHGKFDYTKTYETRWVMAGSYRGSDLSKRSLLTHLCAVDWSASGCRVPPENLADTYADESRNSTRPTCPTCAKKWDRLHAEDLEREKLQLERARLDCLNRIRCKLSAEEATDLTDETIEAVFRRTCLPVGLTQRAKQFRDEGLLTMETLGEVC